MKSKAEKQGKSPSSTPAVGNSGRRGKPSPAETAAAAPPPEISQCCGKPVEVAGDGEGTNHYECTNCGEVCDIAAGKELRIESSPEEKIEALRSGATYFNSDLTQIICCDLNDNVTEVSVCARGPYAVPLERFLKRLSKKEDSKRGGR